MKALLLIGSPRGERSTSASLGRYLLNLLGDKGWETGELHLQKVVRSPEGDADLISDVGSADLVIISFPTYVDSTPAAMIKALSMLAGQNVRSTERTPLMAIANCGFHEAAQNNVALEICRLFGRDGGFEWKGGLALGCGPAIDGRPLAETGGLGRNARRSLEIAASALAEGKTIPDEAVRLMAKNTVPGWMDVFFGNRGWKRRARQNGVQHSLYDRPFMEGK